MKKIVCLVACFFFLSAPNALYGIVLLDNLFGDSDFDMDIDGTDAFNFKVQFGKILPPHGPALPAATGQTESYAPGDDGDLQIGVRWPTPTLQSPRFIDNNDGTVTDNQTGLIWLKDANCFGAIKWEDALQGVSLLEGTVNQDCGLTDGSSEGDWRVPNKNELESIVVIVHSDPALSNTMGTGHWQEGDAFDNVQSAQYFTSTSGIVMPVVMVWIVNFFDGGVIVEFKDDLKHVWPVKAGIVMPND